MKEIYWLGEIIYHVFNLFPDFIKWIVIIGFTLSAIGVWIFKIGEDSNLEVLSHIVGRIFLPILVFSVYRAYFIIENKDITWILSIPGNIYGYFASNPWYLVVIFIIVIGLFFGNETKNNDDFKIDEGGFSPREAKEYEDEQRIKRLMRNLRRWFCKYFYINLPKENWT